MRVQTPQNQQFTAKLRAEQTALVKPPWLRVRPPSGKYAEVSALLRAKKLTTVCAEAHCPNISECWGGGTATFMLMGEVCTRACRFCFVRSGNPRGLLDASEPQRLVEAAGLMKLEYIVLTCVTRDDLADGGASHFAACIKALKAAHPTLLIEVLISDLNGNHDALKTIVDAKPEVIAHNLETVERLQGAVRDPRAGYAKSLRVLEAVKVMDPTRYTKSAQMLGLGETEKEVALSMRDLRARGVDVVTYGQYLRPSEFHIAVHEYVKPEQFKKYHQLALSEGFLYCASGAFVRSSYRAGELFMKNVLKREMAAKI